MQPESETTHIYKDKAAVIRHLGHAVEHLDDALENLKDGLIRYSLGNIVNLVKSFLDDVRQTDDIIFERGATYAFNRLADFNKDGSIDISQLRDDEIIVSPYGKIYRRLVT